MSPQVSCHHKNLSTNLADQELGCLAAGLIAVGQVGRGDGKCTSADKIADGAKDLELVGRVVGDSAAVLHVLCVSEEHGTDNLVTNGRVQVADGGGCESGSLTEIMLGQIIQGGSASVRLTSILRQPPY
jgi:hypothetical protein